MDIKKIDATRPFYAVVAQHRPRGRVRPQPADVQARFSKLELGPPRPWAGTQAQTVTTAHRRAERGRQGRPPQRRVACQGGPQHGRVACQGGPADDRAVPQRDRVRAQRDPLLGSTETYGDLRGRQPQAGGADPSPQAADAKAATKSCARWRRPGPPGPTREASEGDARARRPHREVHLGVGGPTAGTPKTSAKPARLPKAADAAPSYLSDALTRLASASRSVHSASAERRGLHLVWGRGALVRTRQDRPVQPVRRHPELDPPGRHPRAASALKAWGRYHRRHRARPEEFQAADEQNKKSWLVPFLSIALVAHADLSRRSTSST